MATVTISIPPVVDVRISTTLVVSCASVSILVSIDDVDSVAVVFHFLGLLYGEHVLERFDEHASYRVKHFSISLGQSLSILLSKSTFVTP